MSAIDQATKLDLFLDLPFTNSLLMREFTKAFLDESTDIEDVCQDLMDDRNLDSALGVQLDQLGLLVGETRKGRNDDDYRLAIKLRIAINTSNGTVEDVIKVIRLIFTQETEVNVQRVGKALITIYIGVDAPTEDLIPLLQQTIAAGVKIESIVYPSTRLPWIATERDGIITETGILPEIGDDSSNVRIPPERI